MKRFLLFILGMVMVGLLMAQELNLAVSYKYLWANQWDKAIQTYNFSRPFLEKKQPLLAHGINTAASYLFKSTKKIKHGMQLSHAYFRSVAENENFHNQFNAHLLNLGYLLRYQHPERFKKMYADVIISATASALFRKVNGVFVENDGNKVRAYGIGGAVMLKFGYQVKLTNNINLSPMVAVGYTPYLYSPNAEVVINQTKGLATKNFTGIVTGQVGVAMHIHH